MVVRPGAAQQWRNCLALIPSSGAETSHSTAFYESEDLGQEAALPKIRSLCSAQDLQTLGPDLRKMPLADYHHEGSAVHPTSGMFSQDGNEAWAPFIAWSDAQCPEIAQCIFGKMED